MNDTGKSIASRLQHEIFYFMVRLRLVFLAKALLCIVVFYYSLIPSVRKRCYPYLKRRFPNDQGFARWKHCYKLYLCFAEGLLQRSIFGILNENILTGHSKARDCIQNSVPDDKGAIILTAHIGAWQLGIASVEKLNRPINIVQWISEQDTDKHYFEHKEQQNGHAIKIINSRDGVKASFDIIAALQHQELICIAGDRTTESTGESVEAIFLGDTIRLPATAFLLASITQVPLILSFSILKKDKVYGVKTQVLNVPKNLRRNPKALQEIVQCFATAMEDMVQKYPYHFFNFFDMWGQYDSTRV